MGDGFPHSLIRYLYITFEQNVKMVFMERDVPSVAITTVKPVTLLVASVTANAKSAGQAQTVSKVSYKIHCSMFILRHIYINIYIFTHTHTHMSYLSKYLYILFFSPTIV